MRKIFWKVAICFVASLVLSAIVASTIFTRLNRDNIMKLYRDELNNLALSVSNQVSIAVRDDNREDFSVYLRALLDFGEMRNADIWVVANGESDNPLPDQYTNIDLNKVRFDDEHLKALLNVAFNGGNKYYSGYDAMYEKEMIHIATPVENSEGEYIGAVLVIGENHYSSQSGNEYQYYMFISILAALGVSLIISVIFSRQLVRPIIKVKKTALLIAAGDYAQHTNIRRRDELGDLARSMDILSDRLVEAEKFREDLDRNRRDFFSNISHELRTPITVVKGYVETICDGYVTDEEKKQEYYDRILRECVGMERLVSDLLILSKMDNPDFELEVEILNVIAVMQDAVRNIRVLMDEKSLDCKINYNDEKSLIMGDYDRIRQLFLVILQNALKYCDANTTIEVDIKRNNDTICVSITDTGIPIPKSEWEEVFEKFYRGSTHGNTDGSGLGLMVAKHIVEKHGGNISVSSDEIKKTTFHMIFPEADTEELDDE